MEDYLKVATYTLLILLVIKYFRNPAPSVQIDEISYLDKVFNYFQNPAPSVKIDEISYLDKVLDAIQEIHFLECQAVQIQAVEKQAYEFSLLLEKNLEFLCNIGVLGLVTLLYFFILILFLYHAQIYQGIKILLWGPEGLTWHWGVAFSCWILPSGSPASVPLVEKVPYLLPQLAEIASFTDSLLFENHRLFQMELIANGLVLSGVFLLYAAGIFFILYQDRIQSFFRSFYDCLFAEGWKGTGSILKNELF